MLVLSDLSDEEKPVTITLASSSPLGVVAGLSTTRWTIPTGS
jgi:hypothetical protein